MPLLNYTTEIDAEKTIAEISKMLALRRASAILSEYDADGEIFALSFKIDLGGNQISFRLPASG